MDIYDVNEDLIKSLVKAQQIELNSKAFNRIKEDHDKVNYVEELLVKYQQVPKLELKFDFRVAKNDEKSVQYRKEGNAYFSLQKKDYFKALHLYNKSVCFAESGSENLSIGYANRSAILFEWKRYRECLENIRLAREANYPERLLHKLDKREKSCLELEATQPPDEPAHDFQVTYGRHSKVPFIADCLDMKYTEELGRHIVSKRSLKVGDLVCIEDPFCSVLLPAMKYLRCANCKRENYLSLIPCPNCTSAMFCSTECFEKGKSFHSFECPVIDLLFTLFNKIHLIALRVCLTALTIFDTPAECMTFCNEPSNQNHSSFTIDYGNFSEKEHYKAIHGLVTNRSKRSTGDLFQRAVIAAVLKRYLLAKTPLGALLPSEELRNFFVDLLFRHLQTSPSNMHSVDLIEQKNEARDDETIASAAYAFGSLLNHSCAPNITRIYKGTTAYLFILRPIAENGLLFDNYGYHFATQPKRTRQQNLSTQYLFLCKCDACENDFPLYPSLPTPDEVPGQIQMSDVEMLMAYDKQFALDNYKRYCDFLSSCSQFYPCAQLSSAEESLKMALNVLVDCVPLKATYPPQEQQQQQQTRPL